MMACLITTIISLHGFSKISYIINITDKINDSTEFKAKSKNPELDEILQT